MSNKFVELHKRYRDIIKEMQEYLLQENNNVNEVRCLNGDILYIESNCDIDELSKIDAAIEYNKKSGKQTIQNDQIRSEQQKPNKYGPKNPYPPKS